MKLKKIATLLTLALTTPALTYPQVPIVTRTAIYEAVGSHTEKLKSSFVAKLQKLRNNPTAKRAIDIAKKPITIASTTVIIILAAYLAWSKNKRVALHVIPQSSDSDSESSDSEDSLGSAIRQNVALQEPANVSQGKRSPLPDTCIKRMRVSKNEPSDIESDTGSGPVFIKNTPSAETGGHPNQVPQKTDPAISAELTREDCEKKQGEAAGQQPQTKKRRRTALTPNSFANPDITLENPNPESWDIFGTLNSTLIAAIAANNSSTNPDFKTEA